MKVRAGTRRVHTAATPTITDWRGEYYSNRDLTGAPALVRNDTAIGFHWGWNAPSAGRPADGFSVRWPRSLPFEEGLYRFHALVDNGVRVYVDDTLVLDEWHASSGDEVYIVDLAC